MTPPRDNLDIQTETRAPALRKLRRHPGEPGRRFDRSTPAITADSFEMRPPDVEVEPLAQRDRLFRRALIVADLAAAGLGLVAAMAAGVQPRPLVLLLFALVLLLAKILGIYDRDELILRKTTLEEAPQALLTGALAAFGMWLFAAVAFDGSFERSHAVALWVAIAVGLPVSRTLARWLAQRRIQCERLLLIGDSADAERLSRALSGGSRAEIVARVSPARIAVTSSSGEPQVSLTALEGLVRWFGVHRIVVSGQDTVPRVTLELFRAAKVVGVRLSFLPSILATVGPRVTFDDVWGVPLIGVRRFGLTSGQRLAKRVFDLVGGGFVTLVATPILAVVATAIKLDSPGPVFFRQPRVGRDGNIFCIYKFRTMVQDAEALKASLRDRNEAGAGMFKMADDPRITRVGRLLRKTSLDELPQLFNVLKGEMSLVGPRPLVIDEDEQIRGWDRRRLDLTPGMTGHWQILGSARVPLDEMVRIDYRYVAGWSMWEDAKILLRTVPYMLARRGL